LDLMAEESGLDLRVNHEDHSINFGDKARFAFNSYQLTAEAVETLRAFVPVLLEARAGAEGERWMERVHIEGYTDAAGSYLYNVDLSLKRAQSVLCALLSVDLPPEKLRRLQELLIIDGASVTAIKSSPEESRRVEMRLEFRRVGDATSIKRPPDLPMGRCALAVEEGKKGVAKATAGEAGRLPGWLDLFREQLLEP
ncbi:MAG: OmpA family protein, partial [Magnetococcales bacterium]|nr:OmpA family protein [Magnetococcales bacterium]